MKQPQVEQQSRLNGLIREPQPENGPSVPVRESFGANLIPWFLRRFGLGFCYLVLPVPVFFYFLAGGERRKAISAFYAAFYPNQKWRNFFRAYWNYYNFGIGLIDRIAPGSDRFLDVEFVSMDEEDLFIPGSFFVGAHFGDWFRSALVLSTKTSARVSIVIDFQQTPRFRELIGAIGGDRVQFIDASMSQLEFALVIKKAVDSGRYIGFLGDRYHDGQKGVEVDFFGKPKTFPISLYKMAIVMKCPVYCFFSIKKGKGGSHSYLVYNKRIYDGRERVGAAELAKRFVRRLESMVERHPQQWFNFYRFWQEGKIQFPVLDDGNPRSS